VLLELIAIRLDNLLTLAKLVLLDGLALKLLILLQTTCKSVSLAIGVELALLSLLRINAPLVLTLMFGD
jgi:hypothetical protein